MKTRSRSYFTDCNITHYTDVIIILHFLSYQIRGRIFWRAYEVVKNAKKALKEQAGPLILVASTPRELPRSLLNVVLCQYSALLTMHMHSFFMQSSFMVSLGILMNQPSQASFQNGSS